MGAEKSFLGDDDDWGMGAVGCTCAFTVLSLLFLCARLYTRLALVKCPGYEELLISVAWVFSLIITVTTILQVRYGMGKDVSDVPLENMAPLLKWMWMSLWAYIVSLTCIKLSIMVQYKRLFVTIWFQKAVKVMIVVVILYGLAALLDCVFICWPVEYYWNRTGEGHCIDEWPVFYTNAVLNIVTDVMVVLLPMPVLKNLHVQRRQKLGLMLVFAIGAFVCLVSILRLWFLHKTQISANFTRESVQPVTWSSMEANIGIVTASLPTLKPLLPHLFPRLALSSQGSRSRSNHWHTSHLGSGPGFWKPFGLHDTRKNSKNNTDNWAFSTHGRSGHGLVNQLDVEAQPDRGPTLPGQIHVATTIKQDYESAHSSDDAIRSGDEVELIKSV